MDYQAVLFDFDFTLADDGGEPCHNGCGHNGERES